MFFFTSTISQHTLVCCKCQFVAEPMACTDLILARAGNVLVGAQLNREKVDLENRLEVEQEYVVNKLCKQVCCGPAVAGVSEFCAPQFTQDKSRSCAVLPPCFDGVWLVFFKFNQLLVMLRGCAQWSAF